MEDKNSCKMINVRCRDCNKELKSKPGKTITCGCPNMLTVMDERFTANDLTRVIMLNSNKKKKDENNQRKSRQFFSDHKLEKNIPQTKSDQEG